MKGGITSGVIYPRLVSTLSGIYTFRSIGGTSAGAIAAAGAAAAQLGVLARTNPGAFATLNQLPDQLGAPSKARNRSMLLNLFQPQKRLRRHFGLLTAALNAPSGWRGAMRIARAAVWRFPIGALLGASVGIILFFSSYGIGRVLSAILAIVGLVLGAWLAALWSLGRHLPGNFFGLCSGMPSRAGATDALTPWLHGYLNSLAGKSSDAPLTFGELWAGVLRGPGAVAPHDGKTNKAIELAMMTTAVNLGRPFRIPFESRDLFFVEEELQLFFPKVIVDWIVKTSRPSDTANSFSTPDRVLRALPESADLPVVFAVRMSLSFPLLLSAIPLYAIDRTRTKPQACRVYFSDGGICSNFPVHFFDSPLPSRPTFAVNLRDFHPDHKDQRVWLPELLRNNRGIATHIPALKIEPGLRSIFAFLSAIVTTMQNWRDQLQLAMPGFRDRIVHVSHSQTEGGLNLNMDPSVIRTMAASGAKAGQVLADAFVPTNHPKGHNAWDNHRRIRMRLLLGGLYDHARLVSLALARTDTPTWSAVIEDPDPPSYAFANLNERDAALELLSGLDKFAQQLSANGVNLGNGVPRPEPEWRATPRV
jgi:predicted acylesterase/phospholipase RssA